MRKVLVASVGVLTLIASAMGAWAVVKTQYDGWYIEHYGIAPHASVKALMELDTRLDLLAQYSANEINARQIGRQVEMDRLKQKCAVSKCTEYDRRALSNLMEEWNREQSTLESLRSKQAQQQHLQMQQYPTYPYPAR